MSEAVDFMDAEAGPIVDPADSHGVRETAAGLKPVLFIALEFAPIETTGAFRPLAFARHLPDFGIMPHMVSIQPDEAGRVFGAKRNDGLLAGLTGLSRMSHVSSATPVTHDSKLSQFLRIYTKLDDTFFERYRQSLAAEVDRIARQVPISAVIATAPPFGAAKLGELAAERLGVPLILDMRDAWAEWELGPSPTYFHYRAKFRGEARAFGYASAVIATTERMQALFRRTHPGLPADKFHCIPNGFDGPLFENSRTVACAPSGHLNVAYTGTYYYTPHKPRSLLRPHSLLQYWRKVEDWSYRSPAYFFAAMRELRRTNPEAADRIRFHHIGRVPPWLEQMAAEYGVADQCKFWGFVQKQDLPGVLEGMDALLATSMKRLDGGDYFLASKTFDYLEAKKPILAFVAEGSQRDFLENSGAALIFDPDRPHDNAERLAGLLDGSVPLMLDADFINLYHRRNAARQLAGLIDAVTARTPR